MSPLAEITPKGRQKYQEQIDDVHKLFKEFVERNRPALNIDEVATGETWHGIRAAELGLANELMTSDEYLLSRVEQANIYKLSFERPRNVRDRLTSAVSATVVSVLDAVRERAGLAGS